MSQAGVSARSSRARRAEPWLDFPDQDLFRTPADRDTAPASAPAERPERPAASATPTRRTITITGRVADRYDPSTYRAARGRPKRPRHERDGFRPDRTGMWAVLLCVFVLLVAATSSHAATLSRGHRAPATTARVTLRHAAQRRSAAR